MPGWNKRDGTATSRRSAWGILYATGPGRRELGLVFQRGSNSLFGGFGHRHSMPVVAGDSDCDHRIDIAVRTSSDHRKNPVALEQVTQCKTAIFDKTGTLTYGQPKLTKHRAGNSCPIRVIRSESHFLHDATPIEKVKMRSEKCKLIRNGGCLGCYLGVGGLGFSWLAFEVTTDFPTMLHN